jgi:hypothetical protein
MPDEGVEIFLGALDAAPSGIEPKLEVGPVRREHWLPPIPEAGQFDENLQEFESDARSIYFAAIGVTAQDTRFDTEKGFRGTTVLLNVAMVLRD